MTIHLYGIPNCDTVRKARKWLDGKGLSYTFHDYKKEGVDDAALERWADRCGWEVLLNRRGTTWRKLDEAVRDGVDRARALELMAEHPSLIKRPVVTRGDSDLVLVGFTDSEWENALC